MLPIFEKNLRQRRAAERLEKEMITLAGHINAAEYRFIKLMAEFDENHGWEGAGINSFAHWLNWKVGMNAVVAREKVRVSRTLPELPLIAQAFAAGEISYSKVRAMTRVATPQNEEFLLRIARHGTADQLEKLVRKYRYARRINEPVEAWQEAEGVKALYYYQEDDGVYVFHGRLPAEEGALVVKALEALVDEFRADPGSVPPMAGQPRFRGGNSDTAPETGTGATDPGESADAGSGSTEAESESGAMLAPGLANGAGDQSESGEDKPEEATQDGSPESAEDDVNVSAETFSRTMEPADGWRAPKATALVALAEHYLATSKAGARTLSGSDKYHIMLHINANDAHIDQQIEGASRCYLERGRFLSHDVSRRLACNASLTTVLEDDAGRVLNVGRRSRGIPRAIERAILIRDGGRCTFPACLHERFLDFHHIIHWADGGETSLENLVTLCSFHHHQLHKGAFRVHREGGEVVFVNEHNEEIRQSITPQFPNTADADVGHALLIHTHRQMGLDIDEHTSASRWNGDYMDYDMGVSHLFYVDRLEDTYTGKSQSGRE